MQIFLTRRRFSASGKRAIGMDEAGGVYEGFGPAAESFDIPRVNYRESRSERGKA